MRPGITRASLALAAEQRSAVAGFYLDRLGLDSADDGELRLSVGSAELGFSVAAPPRAPFYHFALLVPGNRFDAACAWLAGHAPLLSHPETGETVFDFGFWDAHACYAHDPAGNILELIAHHGHEESSKRGEFRRNELRGISEVGLVTDDLVSALEGLDDAGLRLWSGAVDGPRDGFGFVGRKAHTLILCPTGHPWLPTLRPAEPHPLAVIVRTDKGEDVEVRLEEDALLQVVSA